MPTIFSGVPFRVLVAASSAACAASRVATAPSYAGFFVDSEVRFCGVSASVLLAVSRSDRLLSKLAIIALRSDPVSSLESGFAADNCSISAFTVSSCVK